jgi:hypothetical protein
LSDMVIDGRDALVVDGSGGSKSNEFKYSSGN